MPTYEVTFAAPVVYQPNHIFARRETLTLLVNTDDPDDAVAHALRTTSGCSKVTGVRQVKPVPGHRDGTPLVEEGEASAAAPGTALDA